MQKACKRHVKNACDVGSGYKSNAMVDRASQQGLVGLANSALLWRPDFTLFLTIAREMMPFATEDNSSQNTFVLLFHRTRRKM